jgi:glucose-6-phosphate 1-dehydrogenase
MDDMPQHLQKAVPFSLILFGASGHLAWLKIYPALYTLALKKRLPAEYVIMGFARTPMDDAAFRSLVEESIRTDMPAVTESALRDFLAHCHYHSGQYDVAADFAALDKHLREIEGGEWVRLAYLSVPPTVYGAVFENLCAGGVRAPDRPFRCVVEKPVGQDFDTAEKLWNHVSSCFREEEIFLLDHYLGKEAVRNVYYLRHANPVLERIFKNTLIDHVEIVALESDGLEGRAGYFDEAGTLRDFVQSHTLQICALLTMRLQDEASFRTGRLNALTQLYLPHAPSLDSLIIQGQYAEGRVFDKHVPAYRDEEGVRPGSRTNTFVAARLSTRISRWEGVPFFVCTGKRMAEKQTRITIQFQTPKNVGAGSSPNRLDVILQGEAGMRLHLQTKLGGTEPRFRPLVLADPLVCVGDCLPEHGLLILEAIQGKQQWFLTMDEVRASWRLIDPLQVHLDRPDTPLYLYPAGEFPEQAREWMRRDGREWEEA